jgi:hypothetical protein
MRNEVSGSTHELALHRFFTTLHSALRNPSRAVLQFYPTSDDQIQLITFIAQKAGFGGGVVVDYPNVTTSHNVIDNTTDRHTTTSYDIARPIP